MTDAPTTQQKAAEARREAHEAAGAHLDGCMESDADYLKAYKPIKAAIDRALALARLEVAEEIRKQFMASESKGEFLAYLDGLCDE